MPRTMPDTMPEELEAEPIHEAADGDEAALSVAEKRLRRLKGRPPPLPYNWKDNGNGVYVKLGYSATALGKDWRQPDLELKEKMVEALLMRYAPKCKRATPAAEEEEEEEAEEEGDDAGCVLS